MKNMYSRKNEAQEERKRQKLDAKLVSERFPGVASIIVRMTYANEGNTSLLRTLNFYPDSHAFFKMTCLGEGCEGGGLDLSRVVGSSIKNRKKGVKGEIRCRNKDPEIVHAVMSYQIAIKYS